jgi:hypothetical protein
MLDQAGKLADHPAGYMWRNDQPQDGKVSIMAVSYDARISHKRQVKSCHMMIRKPFSDLNDDA